MVWLKGKEDRSACHGDIATVEEGRKEMET